MEGMDAYEDLPARRVAIASMRAVESGDREGWLGLFTDDALVADPIGPSPFDPEGKGHHGRDAISAFWDKAIAATDKIEFNFVDTFQCGDEEANVEALSRTQIAVQKQT